MKIDALEALTNAIIGLCVSWAATVYVLGFSPSQSAAITAMFFALSFTRAWICAGQCNAMTDTTTNEHAR